MMKPVGARRNLGLVAGVAILATLMAVAATAQPAWTRAVPLSTPILWLNPQVEVSLAVDALDNAVAAWNANGAIHASSRAAGSAWTPAWDVSQPVDYEDTYEPQAAVGPLGAMGSPVGAMVVWTSVTAVPDQSRVYAVKASSRLKGGSWSTPFSLVVSGPEAVDSPRLAVDQLGNAVAVWRRTMAGRSVIQASSRRRGTWTAPVVISAATGDATLPQLGMNPRGFAVAVWQSATTPGGSTAVHSASCSPGGAWSAVGDLSSPAAQASNPRVAVDAAQGAVAVWVEGTAIVGAARSPAGGWGAATQLSTPGIPSYGLPAVAVEPAGFALAAWSELDGAAAVTVATRASGGSWSGPVRVSNADEDVGDPRVAVAQRQPSSMAVVTWIDNATGDVRAAAGEIGSPWSAPVTLGRGLWSNAVEVGAGSLLRALWGAPAGAPGQAWVPMTSSGNASTGDERGGRGRALRRLRF